MHLHDLSSGAVPSEIGAKATRLLWLLERNYPVPATWVVAGPGGEAPADLSAILSSDRTYAVRSSANLEDGEGFSFAGQFLTELEVPAADVPAAVGRVLNSLDSERVSRYLTMAGIDRHRLAMNVIVQEMVNPVVSGVVFSRNPLTGLSERIVEAVAGRGDKLVGEGFTPQRWVNRWGDFRARPDDPLLDDASVEHIVETAGEIEESFGAPVDLEWVWDGERVHWVQMRSITGLDAVNVYSNRIAKEVLPGIIKPLVWSFNVPLVNSAWIELFTEAIGPNDLQPEDLARSFGYRAYFNMGTIGRIFEALGMPRETLELLLGFEGSRQPTFRPSGRTFRHLPRMGLAAVRKLRFGRTVDEMLPRLDRRLRAFEDRDLAKLSDEQLQADIGELTEVVREAAYANIVVPLLMNAYYGVLRRQLESQGIDATTVDVAPVPEAWNPGLHLSRLHRRLTSLSEETKAAVLAGGHRSLSGADPDLAAEVNAFLDRFGHFSDSGNDFSSIPWREDPDHVIQLAVEHAPPPTPGRRSWHDIRFELSPVRRRLIDALRRRTAAFTAHRDAVSFEYTRGYGLLRPRFLEIARRLVERGHLEAEDDIWYLEHTEIQALLDGASVPAADLVARRRAEIEAVRTAAMPEVIFGDHFVPPRVPDATVRRLEGIPTSRGTYRGPIRVVTGREDFNRVTPGDVLVIPFSDVGWTPLFAQAGAVVAESGGILSHSSIVAREYGIPCVVSVPHATALESGVIATVDGYTGFVTLEPPA